MIQEIPYIVKLHLLHSRRFPPLSVIHFGELRPAFQPSALVEKSSPEGDAIVFERWTAAFSSVGIFVIKTDGSGMKQALALPLSRSVLASRAESGMQGQTRTSATDFARQGGVFPRSGPAPRTIPPVSGRPPVGSVESRGLSPKPSCLAPLATSDREVWVIILKR